MDCTLCVADNYLNCYSSLGDLALDYGVIEFNKLLINEHNRVIMLCSTATEENAICALSIETEVASNSN